jgi:hypothetical protein
LRPQILILLVALAAGCSMNFARTTRDDTSMGDFPAGRSGDPEMGHRATAILVINEGDTYSDVSADQSDQSLNRNRMIEQSGLSDQTGLIQIPAIHDDEPEPNSLPHRPLHEIDIQGHQDTGTAAEPCPGRYTYRVPETGEFLYCWGER